MIKMRSTTQRHVTLRAKLQRDSAKQRPSRCKYCKLSDVYKSFPFIYVQFTSSSKRRRWQQLSVRSRSLMGWIASTDIHLGCSFAAAYRNAGMSQDSVDMNIQLPEHRSLHHLLLVP